MADLLSGAMPPVSLKDMIGCVAREIAMRKSVYPRWVQKGRMKQATADEEIRRMEAVLETLRRLDSDFREVEPSDAERAAWPEQTRAYVESLEAKLP